MLKDSLNALFDTLESKGVPIRQGLQEGIPSDELARLLEKNGIPSHPHVLELYEVFDGMKLEFINRTGFYPYNGMVFMDINRAIHDYHFLADEPDIVDRVIHVHGFFGSETDGDECMAEEGSREMMLFPLLHVEDTWLFVDVLDADAPVYIFDVPFGLWKSFDSLAGFIDFLNECYTKDIYRMENGGYSDWEDLGKEAELALTYTPGNTYWLEQLQFARHQI